MNAQYVSAKHFHLHYKSIVPIEIQRLADFAWLSGPYTRLLQKEPYASNPLVQFSKVIFTFLILLEYELPGYICRESATFLHIPSALNMKMLDMLEMFMLRVT